MPRKPGAGRKPAKNEVAAALIAAIKFGNVLKSPTVTSIEQAHFVWMNTGYAIMFDGIVAAGHPIPPDVQGYPHAKLLLDALENTDKVFSWTVHDDGSFEINSEKYKATVPALAYDKVIGTIPDQNQVRVANPDNMLKAFETILKVTTETGDTVMYSSARFTGASIMGTNGAVMLEVRDDNNLPAIIVPRQFLASVVKTGKKPFGMGLGPDWKTFTIWFEDGSWLRTNVYDAETWAATALEIYYSAITTGEESVELTPKIWPAINAVLPFTGEDGRVMIRPGLVKTHPNRSDGAAIEVKEVTATFDVVGKQFLALADIATLYQIGELHNRPVMRVFGPDCRGLVGGLPLLVEQEEAPATWGGQPSPQAAETGGWGTASPIQTLAPPPSNDLNPEGKWKNGPEPGTAQSPEFLSQYHDQPEENFTAEPEDSYIFTVPGDSGIPVTVNPEPNPGFSVGGWLQEAEKQEATWDNV